MVKSRGHFEVARWETTVYVRAVGHADSNNSHLFRDLVEGMLERGFVRFVVDLAACQGMDSTFMGVLGGILRYSRSVDESRPATSVVIVNAGAHCRKLLTDLGLVKILQVPEEAHELPQGVITEKIEATAIDPRARIRMIQRAHENLVTLDQKNREKFGAFLERLARELDSRAP